MDLPIVPQRVQALAETGCSNVPPQYIQPPSHRPRPHHRKTTISDVPLIDLSHFDPQHSGRVREEVRQACKGWGMFQVINHGVLASLLGKMREVGLGFFNSPLDEKVKYSCDPNSPASEGYGSRMLAKEDGILDWRDYFDHHTQPASRRNPNKWPATPSDYREVVLQYSEQMKLLAQKLLQLISESLGLPSLYIVEAIGDPYQNITISYYPPCPQPELTLGLQAHSDMGAVTLLIQDDVGGLQVLKDGEWITIQPLSDAIVVNLGDQTEIISNGEYISAQHRAIVNANRARLSVATFYDPSKSMRISPAQELVTKTSPLCYREVLYGDYVSTWYGEGPEGKRNLDALLINH